jgi:hypothetical protein
MTETWRKRLSIDENSDSPETLMLFSVLLDAARQFEARLSRPFEVKPLALLTWLHLCHPTTDDLNQSAVSGRLPATLDRISLPGPDDPVNGVFISTLRVALQHAPLFGIADPMAIGRLLAIVAQTQTTRDPAIRAYNSGIASRKIVSAQQILDRELARRSPPPPAVAPSPAPAPLPPQPPPRAPYLRPRQPYADRIDERGGHLRAGILQTWFASSRGPVYTRKPDNQDAACATLSGPHLIFAIADGVSTSTGARYGAAATAFFFTACLADCLATSPDRSPALLLKAARMAHIALDSLLDALLAQWNDYDFAEVYADMGRDGAARILQNTRAPKRDWPPALASTLIGGYLTPAGPSAAGHVLRIGDGVVEKLSPPGRCASVLGMDSTVTEVSSYFGPGPIALGSLSAAQVEPVTLDPGEWLLVSSDGLTRGHSNPVAVQLSNLIGPDFLRQLEPREGAALTLLDRAAQAADLAHAANPALFGDNLSLLLIANAGGHAQ